MKFIRHSVAAFLLFTSPIMYGFCCGCPSFTPRSQGVNAARRSFVERLHGLHEDFSYHMWCAPEYTHSFKSKEITKHIFGSEVLVFSGSRVADRASKDILADYFGLPSDFVSHVSFRPVVQNFLVDFNGTINFDWLHEGLYLEIYAPITHTSFDLHLCEQVIKKGENFSPAGYLSGGNLRLTRGQLVSDVTTAFKGQSTFGDMQDPLRFGKIDGKRTKTAVADVRLFIGCDVIKEEDYQVGVSALLSVPTGTRPRAEYLFEPVIGNNHHWELGLGVHGLWEFWHNDACTHRLNLFGKIELSHLFRASQRRSFDLSKNGCGSRYMLLSVLGDTRDDLLLISGASPAKQYLGHLVPAINKTTLDCKVSVALQVQALVGISYRYKAWLCEVGYNLWLRTKEKIKSRKKLANNKFAPKGDAQLYGFFSGTSTEIPVPLNGTQQCATINSGQLSGNADFTNSNLDNPVGATESDTPGSLLNLTLVDSSDLGLSLLQVKGSNPPIFLSDCDIDECSAACPRATSSTFFIRGDYTFEDDQWDPYVGVGVKIEWGHSRHALSEWGVWFEGGFYY